MFWIIQQLTHRKCILKEQLYQITYHCARVVTFDMCLIVFVFILITDSISILTVNYQLSQLK